MKLRIMPNGLFARKLLGTSDHLDDKKFQELVGNDPEKLAEFQQMKRIWKEAERIKIFDQVNIRSDWKAVSASINLYSLNHKRIPLTGYFLRIASLIILTMGLSFGIYRIFMTDGNNSDDIRSSNNTSGFTTYTADNIKKEFTLPDGSIITLNVSSEIIFRDGFGKTSRDLVLNGEAFFDVKEDHQLPFRVFSGESLVEVTGTSFSIYQDKGKVHVSVLSGTVLLSSSVNRQERIALNANQTAMLSESDEIIVEEGIPVNVLSWKTGFLIFDETPIDSALVDIAKHFRRDLEFETNLNERITAEFQNQPLHEILEELSLVAGLAFDTTGTALIVKK